MKIPKNNLYLKEAAVRSKIRTAASLLKLKVDEGIFSGEGKAENESQNEEKRGKAPEAVQL